MIETLKYYISNICYSHNEITFIININVGKNKKLRILLGRTCGMIAGRNKDKTDCTM